MLVGRNGAGPITIRNAIAPIKAAAMAPSARKETIPKLRGDLAGTIWTEAPTTA
jgi:hypothetical protein